MITIDRKIVDFTDMKPGPIKQEYFLPDEDFAPCILYSTHRQVVACKQCFGSITNFHHLSSVKSGKAL